MREILDLLAAMIISPPGSPDPKASRRGHPRFLIFRVLQKLMMLMMLAQQRFEAGLLALPCLRLQNQWKLLPCGCGLARRKDRKSTRLNSSHVAISYAVFCLKKKNQ